jgi:hypothetical protein
VTRSTQPFEIAFEQGPIRRLEGRDGLLVESGTAQVGRARSGQPLGAAELFDESDKPRAPEIGGAQRD